MTNDSGSRLSFGLTASESAALDAVEAKMGGSFVAQARTLGLDPAKSFRRADLRGVDLVNQDLTGFDFSGADLSGADVRGANLRGAWLEGAVLDQVVHDVRTQLPDGTGALLMHFASHGEDLDPSAVFKLPGDGADFFGREKDINAIWLEIEAGRNVLLSAPRRAGKTALLRTMCVAPRPGWDCVFVNLEGCATAADLLMAILNVISRAPFGGRVVKVVSNRLHKAGSGKPGMGQRGAAKWNDVCDAFEQVVGELIDDQRRILLVLDEFTMAVEGLFRSEETRRDAESLLNFFRHIRANPRFARRFQMILTGSVGLRGVLARNHVSASASDLEMYRLGRWSNAEARAYIAKFMQLSPPILDEIFNHIGKEPLPFEVNQMLHHIAAIHHRSKRVTAADIKEIARDMMIHSVHVEHYHERLAEVFDAQEHLIATTILRKIAIDGAQSPSGLEGELGKDATRLHTVLHALIDDGYLSMRRQGRTNSFDFPNAMLRALWQRRL
jgi:uncharacterized protein